MSRNSLLLLFGGRRSVKQPQRPQAYARLTSAVLDNPVAMVAFIVADSEFGSPVSELAANGRILDVSPRRTAARDTPMDLIGPTAPSSADRVAATQDMSTLDSPDGAKS